MCAEFVHLETPVDYLRFQHRGYKTDLPGLKVALELLGGVGGLPALREIMESTDIMIVEQALGYRRRQRAWVITSDPSNQDYTK